MKNQTNVNNTEDNKQETKTEAMFTETTHQSGASRANALNKTAELTSMAATMANECFKYLMADKDKWKESIIESQKSHDAMDELINETDVVKDDSHTFLMLEPEAVLEKMLKSQQSKRSRTKAKVMTQANYITLMTAAIAEMLIRAALGKEKSATNYGVRRVLVKYTEEELEALKNDQEALKKAIRNVQSKKSIMKSKIGFDASSDAWHELLTTEEQLKALRDNAPIQTIVEVIPEDVLEKVQKAEELVTLINQAEDIDKMKAADGKALLNQIKTLLGK